MKAVVLAALATSLFAVTPASAQVVGDAAACQAGRGPGILVNVSGLKDRTGRLKLELYPATEADFLKDDRDLIKEGKFFRRVWADMPASGPVVICIRAPSPGRYALLFTHDRDGKNKFNFWSDGAGFPSRERLGRSRPKLRQALVNIGAGVTRVNIAVQYLRGLRGFSALSD